MTKPSATLTIETLPGGGCRMQERVWPEHLAVTEMLLEVADIRYLNYGGDGFLRIDLANGSALYGEAHRDSAAFVRHFDLLKGEVR